MSVPTASSVFELLHIRNAFGGVVALHHLAVIRTVYGYHVVEVLSRGKAPLPLILQQQEQKHAFGKWLNQQMQHASIRRIARVKTWYC